MPATNLYFNNYDNINEQTLLEDLIIESIKIYGIECYYMPRTLVAEDNIFGEDPLSKFQQAYNVEMYIKSVDGFDGEGDFLSKFNIEIRDEITFVVAKRRWSEEIGDSQSTPVNEDSGVARPAEGDLIYFPLNGKIFEVKFVEHEAVFYQFGDLQTYELRCELFEYSYEDITTGIASIDAVTLGVVGDGLLFGMLAESYNPQARGFVNMVNQHQVANVNITEEGLYDVPPSITFSDPPSSIRATAISYIDYALEGTLNLQVTNAGRGYINPPNIDISAPPERFSRFGDNSLSSEDIGRNVGVEPRRDGDLEFWLYPDGMPDANTFHTVISLGETVYGYFSNGDLGFTRTGDNANTLPYHFVSNTGIQTQVGNKTWNHIQFTKDGSANTVTLSARINGLLVYRKSTSNTEFYPPSSGDLRIGGQTIVLSSNAVLDVEPWSGYIDDVHINENPDDFIGLVKVVRGAPRTGDEAGTLAYFDFNNIQAVATANLTNGAISGINMVNPGYGYYTQAPLVSISNPPVAARANGSAILAVGGGVVDVRINNGGSGYVTPPTVTIGLEQPELPYYLISEENEYIILEEYKGANTAGAKNATFQLEAEGKGEETDFIDFSEFNPFSEGGNW